MLKPSRILCAVVDCDATASHIGAVRGHRIDLCAYHAPRVGEGRHAPIAEGERIMSLITCADCISGREHSS